MTSKFAKKLGQVITNIGVITKDQTNPFFKSNYADINQILPAIKKELHSAGITCMSLLQNNSLINVFIDQETGEVFPNINNDTIGLEIQSTKAQDRGSEITYYRRYSLCSSLLIEQSDDDANKASQGLPVMKEGTVEYKKAVEFLREGGNIKRVSASWNITKEIENKLKAAYV